MRAAPGGFLAHECRCPRCHSDVPAGRAFCPNCQLLVFRAQLSLGYDQHAPTNVVVGGVRVSTDASVAHIIDSVPLLPKLIEKFINYWGKPLQRATHLGFGVRVGPSQFPHLHSMLLVHANAVNVPCPELFIKQDPTLNAYTFGTNDDACVVVHSALIDLLDDQELSFILGHEMGHVAARHVTYGSVLSTAAQGLLGINPIFSLLSAPLDAWSREAERTADQIGIILAEDPTAAIRALMLLAVGSRTLLEDMNIIPYLEQQHDLDNFYGKWNLYFNGTSHPYVVTRVLNLLQFIKSEPAQQARMALGHPAFLLLGTPHPAKTKVRQLGEIRASDTTDLKFCPGCGVEVADHTALSCPICGVTFCLTTHN